MKEEKKVKNIEQYLVRTADIRNVFSYGDTTTWIFNTRKNTENIVDTNPSYRIKVLNQGCEKRIKKLLFKKTAFSWKQNYNGTKMLWKLNKNLHEA